MAIISVDIYFLFLAFYSQIYLSYILKYICLMFSNIFVLYSLTRNVIELKARMIVIFFEILFLDTRKSSPLSPTLINSSIVNCVDTWFLSNPHLGLPPKEVLM